MSTSGVADREKKLRSGVPLPARRLNEATKQEGDIIDAEVVPDVKHPCPHCGAECVRKTKTTTGKKWWQCTNTSCTGGEIDGRPAPWASFHNDPWKPGGQIEKLKSQAGAGTDPPQPSREPAPQEDQLGGLRTPAASSPPDSSVGGGGDESTASEEGPLSGTPAPSSPNGDLGVSDDDKQLFVDTIENALDANLIKWVDVAKAQAFLSAKLPPPIKVAPNRKRINEASGTLLKAIVERLELKQGTGRLL
jgi:predicted RNA-binding Zn-ribbon protein involved in translation (DUF1610 family)